MGDMLRLIHSMKRYTSISNLVIYATAPGNSVERIRDPTSIFRRITPLGTLFLQSYAFNDLIYLARLGRNAASSPSIPLKAFRFELTTPELVANPRIHGHHAGKTRRHPLPPPLDSPPVLTIRNDGSSAEPEVLRGVDSLSGINSGHGGIYGGGRAYAAGGRRQGLGTLGARGAGVLEERGIGAGVRAERHHPDLVLVLNN